MDAQDDAGRLKGVRPLGGTVEFDETWSATLIREFKEEQDVEVTILGAPLFFENIYTRAGAQGHEVLFLAEVAFPDHAFKGKDVITFKEDTGITCTAAWRSLKALRRADIPLYPEGLIDVLER